MAVEFFQCEFAPSWVLIVVRVYLRVAVKAHRNRVPDVVAAVGVHMVGFNLHSAEPAADTASTAATRQ